MIRATLFAALSLLLGPIQVAFGCDLCAVYMAQEAQGESQPATYSGISEQYTRFETMKDDGKVVDNDASQFMRSSILQVYAGFQAFDRVGLQVNVPIINRSFRRPEDGANDEGTTSGLGDASVLAKYFAVDQSSANFGWRLNLIGGVKLPTGDSSRIKEEQNETEPAPGAPESGVHGHDLTLGSGSTDVILGTSVEVHPGRVILPGSVQYVVRTKGAYDYRFANDLNWQLAPGYFVALDHDSSTSVSLSVSGEYKGKDTFEGESADDTGMNAVYAGPQVSMTRGSMFSGQLEYDLPVMIKNTALQLVPTSRMKAGITVRM